MQADIVENLRRRRAVERRRRRAVERHRRRAVGSVPSHAKLATKAELAPGDQPNEEAEERGAVVFIKNNRRRAIGRHRRNVITNQPSHAKEVEVVPGSRKANVQADIAERHRRRAVERHRRRAVGSVPSHAKLATKAELALGDQPSGEAEERGAAVVT